LVDSRDRAVPVSLFGASLCFVVPSMG
jgi:hypothetical protein